MITKTQKEKPVSSCFVNSVDRLSDYRMLRAATAYREASSSTLCLKPVMIDEVTLVLSTMSWRNTA